MSVSHHFREISKSDAELWPHTTAWMDPSIPEQQLKLVTWELDKWIQEKEPMILFDTLKACLQPLSDISRPMLLEVGCGAGHNSVVIDLIGSFHYTGVDYNPKFIELATENFTFNHPHTGFLVDNALNLHFGDRHFDIVLHSACLLHILPWQLALREGARVAKQYLVLHRTPISVNRKTRYFLKVAYGVDCLEIWFSEHELFEEIYKLGFVLNHTWVTSEDLHCRYQTYLLERV